MTKAKKDPNGTKFNFEQIMEAPNKTLPEAQRTQGIAPKLELSLQLMVAPLALVPNLATRWRHLHELKNWPQDGATCISYMN